MAEIVVSALVGVLIEKLVSGALMKFARSEGIESQLKKWKTTLPMIEVVLADAAQKQFKQRAVELWLIELQSLAYDIDDVLDDIATEVMKRKFEESQASSSSSSSSRLLKILPNCCNNFTPRSIMYGRNISSKLDVITSQMNHLLEWKNNLGLDMNVKFNKLNKTDVRFNQTSLIDESKVLGREDDKTALLAKLLGGEEASTNRNVSIVSIVGMGGIGKTTLARLLYNDQKVRDHFEVKAWVCVSDDFDVFSITKQMYQAVGGEDKTFTNLDLLQVALKEKLMKKRFLLVLDDVWNENHQNWELLERPLVGASGSKVIVTTRKTKVASVMNSVELYNLGILSDEIALSLFAQYALDEKNFDKYPSLSLIARGIVKKCDGLPLALITLGRVLKTKGTKEEWEELLNSEIWDLRGESDILPALKLSYFDLSSHLKQVFAYCSLFPKDCEFEKDKLVLLWMAQGFLSQPRGGKSMESLGRQYFEELLARSFFQPSTNQKSRYIMHDLINDLAISVAGEFFFLLEDNKDSNTRNQDFEKFRHFSFTSQRVPDNKKLKELHRARCLRTFLEVSRTGMFYLLNNDIAELLLRLHLLRVLSFTGWSITEVPQSIGNLKHLRYLNFSNTQIKQIPEEVGELYNLQTLLVRGCHRLSSLGVSFAKLINLRHLDLTNTRSLKKMPLGIGGLTSLQTLSKVFIEGGNGFKVSDLKGLNDLQGELSIEWLDKVKDLTEAKDANLQQKKGLDDLKLVWSYFWDESRDLVTEYQVLEKLRPPSKLKKLKIEGYKGMKFPSWLGDPSFDRLTELVLIGCEKCTELPTFEHLTSLQKLEVLKCKKLVSIKGVGSNIMGSLRDVMIEKCDSLESYCCPNSVERLDIWDCDSMTSLSFSKLEKEDLPSSSSSLSSSYKFLKVRSCKNLKSIGEEKVVNVGSSIMHVSFRQVEIFYCDSLESYCCPNSVENLEIKNCRSMTSLSFSKLHGEDLPSLSSSSSSSNMKVLEVSGCINIKTISEEHLQSLTSLEEMKITNCPNMEDSFPSSGLLWPPNMKSLTLGELKKPMPEWGLQNYPSSLVQLWLHGKNSGVVSFGIMEQEEDHVRNNTFLLPPCLTDLVIWEFEEVESVSEVLQQLPHLRSLFIFKCPKLRDVPESTSSLRVDVFE